MYEAIVSIKSTNIVREGKDAADNKNITTAATTTNNINNKFYIACIKTRDYSLLCSDKMKKTPPKRQTCRQMKNLIFPLDSHYSILLMSFQHGRPHRSSTSDSILPFPPLLPSLSPSPVRPSVPLPPCCAWLLLFDLCPRLQVGGAGVQSWPITIRASPSVTRPLWGWIMSRLPTADSPVSGTLSNMDR